MARPIKETPVLTGRDAEEFAKHLANPAAVSASEKEAARQAYEALRLSARSQCKSEHR